MKDRLESRHMRLSHLRLYADSATIFHEEFFIWPMGVRSESFVSFFLPFPARHRSSPLIRRYRVRGARDSRDSCSLTSANKHFHSTELIWLVGLPESRRVLLQRVDSFQFRFLLWDVLPLFSSLSYTEFRILDDQEFRRKTKLNAC